MTDSTIGRIPAMRAVWMEQLRVVGLAIRREAALAGMVADARLFGGDRLQPESRLLQAMVDGEMGGTRLRSRGIPFGLPACVLAALLLPLVVWKGERRFGDTPLWSMPVDHRRHALLKVAAGWAWLLAIVGAALAWATLTTVASGGSLGVDEVRLLVLDPTGATAGTPGAVEGVSWTTPWWEWARLFTSATAAYLLASTLMLATSRPVFWAAGLWLASMLVVSAGDIWDIGRIDQAANFMTWQIGGDALFSQWVELPNGWAKHWTLLPTANMWLASSAFWISLGLAGVLLASGRPRNQ